MIVALVVAAYLAVIVVGALLMATLIDADERHMENEAIRHEIEKILQQTERRFLR